MCTRTRIVWSELHVIHSRVFYDPVCTGTSHQKGTDGAAARASTSTRTSTSRRRVRVPLRVRVPGQPLSRLRDSERVCTSCGEMETSASQHPSIETENRLHPKKCLGYLACRKCQPPLKRDGSIEPGSVLRRVRLSQANQSSAQIPTVDKQQLDREGDQPQGAKFQQLAKRVTSSATFWAGF